MHYPGNRVHYGLEMLIYLKEGSDSTFTRELKYDAIVDPYVYQFFYHNYNLLNQMHSTIKNIDAYISSQIKVVIKLTKYDVLNNKSKIPIHIALLDDKLE